MSAYLKAIELAEQNLSVNPSDFTTNSRLSVYYAAISDVENAGSSIDKSEKLAGDDFNVLYDLAVAASLMGHEERAREFVSRALDAGYPEVMFNSDPEFDEMELLHD